MTWNIINADARDTGLPDRHFHTIATSPPYFGLREYGDDDREIGDEATPDEYIAEMVKVGREAWRVLRDDGTWWLNLGDTYAGGGSGPQGASMCARPGNRIAAAMVSGRDKTASGSIPLKNLLMIPQRVALALQADGWIVRAQIPWIKAACMPESVRDRPTTAHEYVFLLAKSQRYFWDADAVRVPNSPILSGGRQYRQRNGTLDTSRQLRDLPRTNISGGRQTDAPDNPHGRNLRTSDFFHAGLDEYELHLERIRENGGLMLSPDGDPLAFMVNPIGNKLAHFAMWPPRLVAPMIKASTSEKGCCAQCGAPWTRVVEMGESSWERRKADGAPMRYGSDGSGQHQKRGRSTHAIDRASGGLGLPAKRNHIGFAPSCECNAGDPIPCRVLDPFAGSGTTLQVCEALGRDSTGVELMAKNLPIVHERMATRLHPDDLSELPKADPRQGTLFD